MQYSIENFHLLGYVLEKSEDDSILVITSDFLNQEKEPAFRKFLDSITYEVINKSKDAPKPCQIENLLVSIDNNNLATVIINELEILVSGYTKYKFKTGDQVKINDLAHIKSAEIKNHLQSGNRFIFIFNIGWARGVCFDLTPRDKQYAGVSVDVTHLWIGQAISYLTFKNHFLINDVNWEYFFENYFFPFIYLDSDLMHDLKNIADEQRNDFDDLIVPKLSERFKTDLRNLKEKWNKNPVIL